MKRTFKYLMLIFISMYAVNCNGNEENGGCPSIVRDFVNWDVCFTVLNAEGENLFDPATEGNILDNAITVEYKGETYTLKNDYKSGTRANMAIWYGLRIEPHSSKDDTIMMKFGEFDTEAGYHGETFTVDWGDETSDEVTFDVFVTYEECDPTVLKKIWLDGELKSDDSLIIEIVK